MKGSCEADFAGFLGVGLRIWGLDGRFEEEGAGGTYAFKGRFRGQTCFGIVLTTDGRYRRSSQHKSNTALYYGQSGELCGTSCS